MITPTSDTNTNDTQENIPTTDELDNENDQGTTFTVDGQSETFTTDEHAAEDANSGALNPTTDDAAQPASDSHYEAEESAEDDSAQTGIKENTADNSANESAVANDTGDKADSKDQGETEKKRSRNSNRNTDTRGQKKDNKESNTVTDKDKTKTKSVVKPESNNETRRQPINHRRTIDEDPQQIKIDQ